MEPSRKVDMLATSDKGQETREKGFRRLEVWKKADELREKKRFYEIANCSLRLALGKIQGSEASMMLQKVDKFFNCKTGLIYNGAESSFGKISSWMVGYDRSSMSFSIVPNFVTPFCMAVEYKPGFAKHMNYLRCFKDWKPAHASTGTGIFTSSLKCGFAPLVRFLGSGSPFSRQDSMILRATSSAISMVSAMVLPWAIKPCRTWLVARYWPSFRYSIEMGIRYSDIIFMPPIASITQEDKLVKQEEKQAVLI